jgi:hypothetical protein
MRFNISAGQNLVTKANFESFRRRRDRAVKDGWGRNRRDTNLRLSLQTVSYCTDRSLSLLATPFQQQLCRHSGHRHTRRGRRNRQRGFFDGWLQQTEHWRHTRTTDALSLRRHRLFKFCNDSNFQKNFNPQGIPPNCYNM